MPISPEDEAIGKETMALLQKHAKEVRRPVLITPERMEVLQRSSRMRMTCIIEGVQVQLVEDPGASESLEAAFAEACAVEEQKQEMSVRVVGRCAQCTGNVVLMGDGTKMCITCGTAQVESKSNIVLASERAELSKHRKFRKH